jgi:hypothetical protein
MAKSVRNSKLSRSDLYTYAAMSVKDPIVADDLLTEFVTWTMANNVGLTHDNAEAWCKELIGLRAGYYDMYRRRHVERLFNCVHPYLGPANEITPSPEAFAELSRLLETGNLVRRFIQPTGRSPVAVAPVGEKRAPDMKRKPSKDWW